jgi:hypothetical protein
MIKSHESMPEQPLPEIFSARTIPDSRYYAIRLLRQHGVDARNLSGGWQTYRMLFA